MPPKSKYPLASPAQGHIVANFSSAVDNPRVSSFYSEDALEMSLATMGFTLQEEIEAVITSLRESFNKEDYRTTLQAQRSFDNILKRVRDANLVEDTVTQKSFTVSSEGEAVQVEHHRKIVQTLSERNQRANPDDQQRILDDATFQPRLPAGGPPSGTPTQGD